MKRSAYVAVSFFALLLAKSASATVVYTQPSLGNGVGGFYSEASGFFQVADNFTLASSATINQVSWVGGTDAGPVTSFGMSFYADNSGTPGALLTTFNLSVTGTDLGAGPLSPTGSDFEIYSYDSNIPAFSATGGTQYWISIFDYGTSEQYYWNTGTGGDGSSDDFNFGGITVDEAFTLYGGTSVVSATPEPSSVVLAGSGILTLAGAIRRRMKK